MVIEPFETRVRVSQIFLYKDTVYFAGQDAQSAPGETGAKQTQAILNQIDGLLAEGVSDKTKILSATIWICSMDDFVGMNSVWDSWVPKGHAPCRTCVG